MGCSAESTFLRFFQHVKKFVIKLITHVNISSVVNSSSPDPDRRLQNHVGLGYRPSHTLLYPQHLRGSLRHDVSTNLHHTSLDCHITVGAAGRELG